MKITEAFMKEILIEDYQTIYSILYFYRDDFFNQPDKYREFGGYDYMCLVNCYRGLYGGSKLQNHASYSKIQALKELND